VVFDDVYIRVAPTNPQKRSTQSTLIVTPILKKKTPIVFRVFTLKASQNVLINGFKTSFSRSKGLK